MIKKIFILVTISFQTIYAQNIESILDLVDKNNHTLKQQQNMIYSNKVGIDLSQTWKNPVLGFGINDINLDDPTSRDIEAMQTQYITYSQSIPTNGKLETQKKIQEYSLQIQKLQYENNKKKLKSQALKYSYNIYFEQKKLEIINKYLQNLEKQKSLMKLLYENGKIDQSKIVNIDIRIYKLKLQKQKLDYLLSQQKLFLENIVYQKIDTIAFSIDKYKRVFDTKNAIQNHPLVMIEKLKIQQQKEQTNLIEKEKISDVKFTVGYYEREKFDDYISFNVAIPLSIQGTEKLKMKKSHFNTMALKDNLKSLEQQLKITIKELESKMKVSKQNFELIEKTMIPLNDTLEESHTIHLSTNMMNSISIYESTNSKYELMLLSKTEKLSFFNAKSKLLYFKGNL